MIPQSLDIIHILTVIVVLIQCMKTTYTALHEVYGGLPRKPHSVNAISVVWERDQHVVVGGSTEAVGCEGRTQLVLALHSILSNTKLTGHTVDGKGNFWKLDKFTCFVLSINDALSATKNLIFYTMLKINRQKFTLAIVQTSCVDTTNIQQYNCTVSVRDIWNMHAPVIAFYHMQTLSLWLLHVESYNDINLNFWCSRGSRGGKKRNAKQSRTSVFSTAQSSI